MHTQALAGRVTRYTMLICTYLLVAAAAFCGMYAKHGFGDGDPAASLAAILDGTAQRPYIYRQLLPAIANLGDTILPDKMKADFLAHLEKDAPAHNPLRATFARATSTDNPAWALRYYLVYALAFCSLVAAMLMLRIICIDLTGDEAASTLAPLAFAIAVPATFYYDFPELLFMTLAVWLACRGRLLWLVPLVAIATLNKESFPVFAITLFPFLRLRVSRRAAIACLGACLAAGALVNVLIKYRYAANPGSPAFFNLWFNLRFYATPHNYFLSEWTYSIPLPRPANVVVLVLLALILCTGWPGLPTCVKQHALMASALNVPLFLTLGYVDEVRALSMLDVSATLLLTTTACAYLARSRVRAEAQRPPAQNDRAMSGRDTAVTDAPALP